MTINALAEVNFNFLRQHNVLVAVSGGVDSVVLLHLLYIKKINIHIAHCNFQLRGEESDSDEAFVRQLANHYQIPVHIARFETKKYAQTNKISIQIAARKLRYEWFEELRKTHQLDFIATAHHASDFTETIFINLLRGTGIEGLHGIKKQNGHIIRPLLAYTREQIMSYAQENAISWREDSSNSSDKYTRNLLRHEVIPILKTINPALENTMLENAARIEAVEQVFMGIIAEIRAKCITQANGLDIPIDLLGSDIQTSTVKLHYLLREYGFNYYTAKEIANSLEGISGKVFYSSTHQLIKDRNYLLLRLAKPEVVPNTIEITKNDTQFTVEGITFDFLLLNTPPATMSYSPDKVMIDADLLHFPLTIRRWQKGDKFRPLGMKGFKKISDFLIDTKVALPDKEKVYLLCEKENIVWIIGYRLDDRYKVSSTTKSYLCISKLSEKKS
jgi:tRNA(Ile)-lysidine synthase